MPLDGFAPSLRWWGEPEEPRVRVGAPRTDLSCSLWATLAAPSGEEVPLGRDRGQLSLWPEAGPGPAPCSPCCHVCAGMAKQGPTEGLVPCSGL